MLGWACQRSGEAASRSSTKIKKFRLEVVRRPQQQNQQWVGAGDLPLFPEEPCLIKPFPILPKRWIVERTNAWNDRPRRMNRVYDRLNEVSTSWIWLLEARMLLTRLTSTRPDSIQDGTV